MDSDRWLLKVSSASDSKRPKHQQDSSPCQAKNTQTECFTSPLEPIKNKASVPKHPNASSSRASAKQKTVRNVDSERWLLKVSSASDSKRPKHQQDSSPCQKKSLEPQSTCPAYANTTWTWIPNDGCSKSRQRQIRKDRNTSKIRAHAKNNLWSHRAHAQPMQTPSGLSRCKKTQTPSRHEPKTAQTASQKTLSRHLWKPLIKLIITINNTINNNLDTSRKPPKPQAKKLFHVTFGIHINKTIFGATEHMPSLCKHHVDNADAKRLKHHLDTSRSFTSPLEST